MHCGINQSSILHNTNAVVIIYGTNNLDGDKPNDITKELICVVAFLHKDELHLMEKGYKNLPIPSVKY